MQKPFKFKYASEIAGTFVIVTIGLLLAGIFVAGNTQGWFDDKFSVKTLFDTEQGSFGLREGSEILVRSQAAGRVVSIEPNADGSILALFVIKESFRQYVKKDSVAKVKKKLAASDAFVVIEGGKGAVISDGDFLSAEKDEEIMQKAQAVLNDVQEVVMPLVKEVNDLLKNVNSILKDVDKGTGIAGSLINDKELSNDIKDIVKNSNTLIDESRKTFTESTRLIKAAQKSWLLRKHVEKDKKKEEFTPLNLSDEDFSALKEKSRNSLESARIENNSRAITENAVKLAYCLLAEKKYEKVQTLLQEAKMEGKGAAAQLRKTDILEVQLMSRTGKSDEALKKISELLDSLNRSDRALQAECRIISARLLQNEGKNDEARKLIKEARYYISKLESVPFQAEAVNVLAKSYLDGDHAALAALHFDTESTLRAQAGQYIQMVEALHNAGKVYAAMDEKGKAADRFFRAGRSLSSSGKTEDAKKMLNLALSTARETGNEYIIEQAESLLAEE